MASYAYGGLLVRVTADMKPATAEIAAGAKKAGDEAGQTISRQISGHLGRAASGLGKGIATALGTGVIAATAFGVESFKAAAKVDTMNASLKALATANHTSYARMQDTIGALRKQGIEAGAAQSIVASFTKGHLDLAKATQLGTIAQNASAITGKSSADTIALLNKGIQTQNVRLLRTAGVAVDVKKAQADYAAQLGINVKALDSTQKSQAVLNAVLQNGQKVAGAYAAAMKTPGGVLKQLPVIIDEVKVSVGEGLVKALGPAIVAAGHLAVVVEEAIAPGGRLAPVFDAIGRSATKMLSPLTGVIDLTTKWVEGLKPGEVNKMADSLARFAPEIAAVATGLASFAGKNLLGDLPVVGKLLGGLGGPLGIVISGLATLALTSPQTRAVLGQLAQTLMGALGPILKQITPIIGELGTSLAVLLASGLRAVVPLIPALVLALQAALDIVIVLLPAVTWLANVLAKFAPVLVPLIAVWWLYSAAMDAVAAATEAGTVANVAHFIGMAVGYAQIVAQTVATYAMAAAQWVVRAATAAWAIAQWAINAALTANPIGIVIIALAAFAGMLVLLWTRSAAFRTIVEASWNALRSAAATVTNAIAANWQTMVRIVLAVVTGGMSELVLLVVRNWTQIRNFTTGTLSAISNAAANTWRAMISTASNLWGSLSGVISRAWSNIVNGARLAGGSVINGLKSGMQSAISGIGGWIKSQIVDPLVNAVKHFFGIKSPSTVMAGIGQNLTRGLFVGMVPGMSGVGSLVGDVFGGFPQALAGMISHGLVGIAGLPGRALNALMGLFSGGDAGKLASTAFGFNGHRYVWGGGANATTGFDCSSFVNMLSGMLGLRIPGGFHAPSSQHGPVTTGWLGAGMQRVAESAMRINDLFVNDVHMGVVTGPGMGFAARSTATGTGPQPVSGYDILRFPGGLKLPGWLSGVMGKIGGLLGGLFGGGKGPAGGQGDPAGVGKWAGIVNQVLGMFGRPDLAPVIMSQIGSESGGNQFAQNNWDSNAKAGTPSKGLLQLIQPTFDAFAGPFRNLGIWSPLANIYAGVAYALKRYGASIASVLGHGHGYAAGGIIGEHVVGFGQRSGDVYHIGEAGPEMISPLTGPAARGLGGSAARTVINVYPSAGMDEQALAAMVSRELAWATAGGMS